MTKLIIYGLIVGLLCPLFGAQTAQTEQLNALNGKFVQAYGQKNWAEALRFLERMAELSKSMTDRQILAGVLYNKACVLSLAGRKPLAIAAIREAVASGYTDYAKYAGDSDFDSLRGDPEFKSLLSDLKAKYGPRPLTWDRSQSPPLFSVIYDDPQTPEFAELRKEFAIDEAVADAKDDYDRLRRLTAWVSARWQHSSNQTASKTDPFTILREAQKGGRFICRDYAVVLAGVAGAFGMPARLLNLLPKDVETRSEAHSVTEVWLEQFHKWVLADGQYGAIGELDGVPLSGLELQAAFAEDKPVRCSVGVGRCAEWKPFMLRNAYYFKIGDDQRSFRRGVQKQLVLVPAGAPNPHKFAGGNEEVFAGAVYTSNPETFYAPPPARGGSTR